MQDLVIATPDGLYCPPGDFHIDPWRPVGDAVITHAHADHARSGHAAYLAARDSAGVLRARLGADIALTTLDWGETMQRRCQVQYRWIAQSVKDPLAVASRDQQAGLSHEPQMLRSIADRQSSPLGERLDATLALCQQLENFQAMRVTERLRHFGELHVELLLGARTCGRGLCCFHSTELCNQPVPLASCASRPARYAEGVTP